jgi:hypothetical protein
MSRAFQALFKEFQESMGQLAMMTTSKFQATVNTRKAAILSQMDNLMEDYPDEAKRVGVAPVCSLHDLAI